MLIALHIIWLRVILSEQITGKSSEMRNEEMTEMGGVIFFFLIDCCPFL